MKMRFAILPILLATASASANTAVTEPNGKLDTAYANLNSTDAWVTGGSFSMPLAESLGFQLDALHTRASGNEFTGIGGHLFWRDHEVGLIGVTAGGVWGDDVDSYEFGLEAEYYLNNWLTLGARAGFASIDYDPGFFLSDPDDDGLYGILYATAYPHKDLAITLSVEQRFDRAAASIGVEYDLPINGLTTFVEGMVSEDDYDHVMVGFRYYFGSDKSLQERHRQDDPPNILFGILEPMQIQPETGRRQPPE